MIRRRFVVTLGGALSQAPKAFGQNPPAIDAAERETAKAVASDPVLTAIYTELLRFKKGAASLEPPYFVEVTVEDAQMLSLSATLGAAFPPAAQRARPVRVFVRVGSPQFDNSNSIFTDASPGTRYDLGRLPVDNSILALRTEIWLALDRAHRAAVESFGRKRAAVGGITVKDPLPDFWMPQSLAVVEPLNSEKVDRDFWLSRVKSLSSIFASEPAITQSSVEFDSSIGTAYLLNTAPSVVRVPDTVAILRARASRQAPDGMVVYDGSMMAALAAGLLPPEEAQRAMVEQVARNVAALAAAPLGDPYSGPVLFEGAAAPQIFGQIWGDHLGVTRRPVAEPGRNLPILTSELENRLNARVLPEWVSLVDDPGLKEIDGVPAAGHYRVDIEGVAARRVELVSSGVLKSLLVSLQPVRGVDGPNGHARLPGSFGVRTPRISNLLFETRQALPAAELRKKLVETAAQLGKPYGIVIKKVDFPSFAPPDELRRIGQRTVRGGGGRPTAPPLLVYRLYPDGREELVRGLRFRGLGLRSFRDLLAAGGDRTVYNYIDNGAPLSLVGAGSYVIGCSVTAPSLLFEEVELETAAEDLAKPPIVPPPSSV